MDHFLYKGGALHAEDVPVAEIAASVGSPFYVYSAATLTRQRPMPVDALADPQVIIDTDAPFVSVNFTVSPVRST